MWHSPPEPRLFLAGPPRAGGFFWILFRFHPPPPHSNGDRLMWSSLTTHLYFMNMAEHDVIPPPSVPLRLIEFRVCWELHAMLRINKIPYTVESSELPFAMDRPLPLLVHGEHVYSSRNQVLEHVALYKPSASQSSDREFELAASEAARAFSDDATLSAYFEKMEALLLHWKRLRGIESLEDTSSLPFLHSTALWLQGIARATVTWAATAHVMPDLGDEDVLLRLQDFYAALNRLLATILEGHGFVGTVHRASYRPAPVAVEGNPSRRQSINLGGGSTSSSHNSSNSSSSSGASSNGGGRSYSVADALLFGHLTQALCLPEIASKLLEYANIMLYYKNMARELFGNPDTPRGDEDMKDLWDRNTLDVLRRNLFARRPNTEATLREALEFDLARAEAKEMARNDSEAAVEGDKGQRNMVFWSQLSVTTSKPPPVPELVGSQRWARTVPLTGVAFALAVSGGVLAGYLLHRR